LLPGVKLAYTANISGDIEPCGCRNNPTGGLVRFWEFCRKENLLDPATTLLVDSGDLLFASTPAPPFLVGQWKAQAQGLMEALNELGYDAAAPGDLDFAAGLAVFEELRALARFPYLSANLRKDGKEYLPAHVILTRAGKKIAFFGLYDEALPLPPSLTAEPHVDAAREQVSQLSGKADVVVALTHLGLDKDKALATQVSGMDFIIGSHTQSFLQEPVRIGRTVIFQTSFRNQHAGIISGGTHRLIPLDDEFEPKTDAARKTNPMITTVADTKAHVAKINKAAESELLSASVPQGTAPRYQTFTTCVECHKPQFEFYRRTPHGRSYMALVGKKQNFNKDCLRCHTLGMNEESGWTQVDELVFDAKGQPVQPSDFARRLPQMPTTQVVRHQKAFINVQCEHCHGAAGQHPFGASGFRKPVVATTCLQCHTPEQAPGWYADGEPQETVIAAKIKAMTCPRK
jgi:hypothetical protein